MHNNAALRAPEHVSMCLEMATQFESQDPFLKLYVKSYNNAQYVVTLEDIPHATFKIWNLISNQVTSYYTILRLLVKFKLRADDVYYNISVTLIHKTIPQYLSECIVKTIIFGKSSPILSCFMVLQLQKFSKWG